jgi:hypothetical protein
LADSDWLFPRCSRRCRFSLASRPDDGLAMVMRNDHNCKKEVQSRIVTRHDAIKS